MLVEIHFAKKSKNLQLEDVIMLRKMLLMSRQKGIEKCEKLISIYANLKETS